ncbi:hypothetical protein EV360DRAFT_71790 [Lentinula raphanica]|nr:hypothetical protein EV360DRAFT_71790 [Lentinula raphanica]
MLFSFHNVLFLSIACSPFGRLPPVGQTIRKAGNIQRPWRIPIDILGRITPETQLAVSLPYTPYSVFSMDHLISSIVGAPAETRKHMPLQVTNQVQVEVLPFLRTFTANFARAQRWQLNAAIHAA